ncbi:NSS family neurotransmitter:Na+ symporter [Tamaricihabitans halophyticus]|uniref:NSS family neurotransmitter:Na+ symporter n=1 Tax=Tamaricihabitans halophyticus TaxID=1262583 RepID=A0A4R2QW33_9PSEU|nr:sodium-dependent transporter [Tamaricihabitans halophyticus]TCP54293.1 NSS family neurotransmitter:Na+ symporter [Tamaricihabitans halophyticus]
MQDRPREQWGTRAGFLLAAIGSAIGLGNIWRFPYVAYDGGGGAFLVPYLVALLTAGIPLLILEYTIGHKYRGAPPTAFLRMSKAAQPLGWWQVGVSFVIAVYYAVIVAWAVRFAGFSINKQWGNDPDSFFFNDFLQVADEPGAPTSYVSGVAWPLIAVWVITLGVLLLGVRKGIERANRIFIPLLVVLFLVLVVRALTLPGAVDGLNALFTPDWSEITNGSVWVAAYGQIFFSLSIGFGIMITYTSYLRRKADLTGSALVAGFSNSSFEILAGIGVFATLGFMAGAAGVPVGELATDGIGLAFVAFPEIISNMPAGALFGVLFFGSLAIAGFTSLISIVQVVVGAVQDRTGIGRVPAVLGAGGVTALVSIALFPTNEGMYILDVVDRFINQYGIALAGLVVVIAVSWIMRKLPVLQRHANQTSAVPLGGWWRIMLGLITPIVLGWMMWDSLRTELSANYEDYPTSLLISAGWAVALGVIVFAVIMSVLPWKHGGRETQPTEAGEEAKN